MHRLWNPISLALIMLSLPGVAAPGIAQQPAKDLVPFKASLSNQSQSFPIPVDPMIIAQSGTLSGQSDLLGTFSGPAIAMLHLGVDGQPLFVTVLAEWSMANGDALSVEATDLFLPQTTPGGPLFEGALIITNGKGRFLGATGSGFIKGVLQMDPVTRQGSVAVSVEGLITRPK